MTTLGSLMDYTKAVWTETSPGTSTLIFAEGWFNPLFPYSPQITFSDLVSPVQKKYGTGGTTTIIYKKRFLVNAWMQLTPGDTVGTLESLYVNNMRKEVSRIFRTGIANNYGGSLSPLKVCMPENEGTPKHTVDKAPLILRYELTLVGIVENE